MLFRPKQGRKFLFVIWFLDRPFQWLFAFLPEIAQLFHFDWSLHDQKGMFKNMLTLQQI